MKYLVVFVLLFSTTVAFADERKPITVTDPVTKITGGAWILDMEATRFLITRDEIDVCNANEALVPRLRADLVLVQSELIATHEPEPGWQIATRWAAIGLAIGGAFVAGLWVGS